MMAQDKTHALSDVLDRLEESLVGKQILFGDVVGAIGPSSFSSLMLIFSLICTSPASAIPGVTSAVALVVCILTVQMIAGREAVWLPRFLMHRHISTVTLGKGIKWLRKPVRFVERFLKVRLTFVFHRPWLWLPLILILCLTIIMPFMEVIPASGSIASTIIALFAAGMLTRDGALVLIALALLLAVPITIWGLGHFG
ncbi:exopolysaccharide biosynthesis protein [Sulfitobacter sp. F26204]|uniref:exopolysaccharide biosynthesis protein n=1 Tax=Sulfitobacter sp. F26204 TaxID=2996014 RepID=UPI00225E5295|nr:exopolysaccharide biosynthesis protein [Sulfitobacter sp. F26204]MCX7560271.1 exopolysaccharide biosynthesis protein [Sulfitobacter sp. F26204]